jgi:hypothetical protein
MPVERTIDDVIEEHRVLVGAEEVRVTLCPGATAENLATELAFAREASRVYNSFTDLEKAEATIARFRAKFGRIRNLTSRGQKSSTDTYEKKLHEIFLEADWLVHVDQANDTAWMVAQRVKKGVALPDGVLPPPQQS